MKRTKIVIFCAGEHGRVVLDILSYSNFDIIGFVDDDPKLHYRRVDGIPILGGFSVVHSLIKNGVEGAIIALGDNKKRADIFNKVKKVGLQPINAVHPHSTIAKSVVLGKGISIMPRVVINTGTKINDNTIINTGALIEHDNIIEKHVHIGSGVNLAGGVKVKEYSFVGIGVTVIDDITIGKNSVIGAGSVVIKDVPDGAVVAGSPAHIIHKRKV